MKKQNVLWIMAIAILFFGSCEKKNGIDPLQGNQSDKVMKSVAMELVSWPEESEGCNLQVFDLFGGQQIYMGSVSVITYAGSLFVKYEVNEGCLIKETHLFVGDIENLPTGKDGNPKIGHFPVKWESEQGLPVVVHQIDLDDVEQCFDIAAHAVVWCENGEETAWAKASNQVIAIKSRMDYSGSQDWAITGEESGYTGDKWCSNFLYYSVMEVLDAPDDAPFKLVYFWNGNNIIGSLSGELDGDILRIIVKSNTGPVYKTHLFMGSVEGLDEHGICSYATFPYLIESLNVGGDDEHVFEFPTSHEFAGNRWGWYISGYCGDGC